MTTTQAVRKPTLIAKIQPENASGTDAFYFPQGLAGFSEAKNFGFIYQGHGDIVCIQGIDHPEAALLLTPWDEARLGKPPRLSEDQRRCLALGDQHKPMWMLVLNPFVDQQWVTANLKAPIALNLDTRQGLQYINADPDLEVRHHWMPQPD